MPIIRVAIDVPVDTLFDYRILDATAADIGRRVQVPFGNKTATGVIIEVSSASEVPEARLKNALRVLRDMPPLAPEDLRLIRFAADYYCHPLGAVVMDTLPSRLRKVAAGSSRPARRGVYLLTAAGTALAAAALPGRAHARLRLLARLRSGPLGTAEAKALSSSAPSLLKQFIARGWVKQEEDSGTDKPPLPPAATSPPVLSPEQAIAVAEIRAGLGRYQPFLLLGVTGSGKTEVYLHAIGATLDAGRQALLLVPEIALTPQLEALVALRYPRTRTVSLHSGLAESERLESWRAARDGQARIILGTRLAVFAPLPDLGLIVVDEEQDGSFKQSEGFRYSARDLAVTRARQRDVPIVLGTATPAFETYHNAVTGRYTLLELSSRIGAPAPHIVCVDTRNEKLADGLSRRLLDALRSRIAAGEQSLIFVNRRGYAPVLMCRACGWTSGCRRCAALLVLHLAARRLRCHHCGHDSPIPVACPDCGNPDLAPVGQGTQRVEEALARHFPQARILRIDRDTTSRRSAWQAMRRRIQDREVDVLVGTQILAKGHDFPHLNLVGVLNADSRLYSSDFRAAEQLYALLTQVAGRAGRSGVQGEVLIQTEFPHHPLYAALCRQDYRAFADGALAERKQAGFPPFVYQALLRAEAPQLATALAFLAQAARKGKGLDAGVTIYDPVPAALPRRAGRERAQLLVQSESRQQLRTFLAAWRGGLSDLRATRARWSLDVDPLDF
ncbi:MAG TPA: primosomal protein N' [Burkholderiales bacterium]|nr:primosomal protein N' [Burkholderiales bacterium]